MGCEGVCYEGLSIGCVNRVYYPLQQGTASSNFPGVQAPSLSAQSPLVEERRHSKQVSRTSNTVLSTAPS